MTFTVYSRDGCPYCDKVQQVLQLAEIKHVIYKLNRDFTREEFHNKFGEDSTFPIVVNGDEFICLLYTSPSPRDLSTSRMPSSA